MQDKPEHAFASPQVGGLLALPGIGIGAMLSAYPHPNAIFCVGLAVALLGAAGAFWNLYDEWRYKKRHRVVVAGIAVIAIIVPSVIVVSALFKNAADLAETKKAKYWQMTAREQADLKLYLCPAAKKAGPVLVGSVNETPSGFYATQILEILKSCNADVYNVWTPNDKYGAPAPLGIWTEPDKTGVFIGVMDINNPDQENVGLLAAFHRSGIEAKLISIAGSSYYPPAKQIFIGPRP